PRETLRVVRECRWQSLDCDLAAEPRVTRPMDLPHSTRPQGGEDLVGTDTRARNERHGESILVQGAPSRWIGAVPPSRPCGSIPAREARNGGVPRMPDEGKMKNARTCGSRC